MQAALTENIGINEAIQCPCCGQFVTGRRYLMDDQAQVISNSKGVSVRFTKRQFELAQYLIDKYPQPVTKEQIYDNVLADHAGDGPELKIIDVMICKIRPQMAQLGLVIETVWGVGYRLLDADPALAGAIMEASFKNRGRGRAHRWTDEDEINLTKLVRRGINVSQCAAMLKLPYGTVERHMKDIKAKLAAEKSTKQ